MMTPEEQLAHLSLTLPNVPAAAGAYVPLVQDGKTIYLSGSICMVDGKMKYSGMVGKDLSIEDAYLAAQLCGLLQLAILKSHLGELSLVERILMVNGFVQAEAGFHQSPQVINGCSELYKKVFGAAGEHARAAVSVGGLPLNSAVEVATIVKIK